MDLSLSHSLSRAALALGFLSASLSEHVLATATLSSLRQTILRGVMDVVGVHHVEHWVEARK
eukprot:9638155-Prorocentrum_lima.AAC.1